MVPLGVAEVPAPTGLIGVKSVDIGNGKLAQLAGGGSEYAADLYDLSNVMKRLARLVPGVG